MTNDQPRVFRLPQNAAFSARPERHAFNLKGGSSLAYIVHRSEKHKDRLR
jgi:hypothetical protein